ncbi:MAG: GAF domain-containing protein [Acetobacter sp.]|jgi:GAF domain-containing protein|nr:GAF domain-containing protein [Acetobacter sp.]MCH4062705.1 GAF domain-containing protein [Acetobacter sp.]MCH4088449.1 GAF domain-containing protein [Acetobacter sp.]MCI1295062.1 GAF domain-containing protein [Acetobacter sp.]MCI1321119.1 GAF domain-containing protein [Acetobacter sp.]
MSAPSSAFTEDDILSAAQALVNDEQDFIARTANLSALLYEAMRDVNWAGFYFLKGEELVLGPFQGRIACTRIPLGKGVCGTAAERAETIIVPDVHAFPGHIACDSASASEIVVPLFKDGKLMGVLDIDSPKRDRFSNADQLMLEQIASLLEG